MRLYSGGLCAVGSGGAQALTKRELTSKRHATGTMTVSVCRDSSQETILASSACDLRRAKQSRSRVDVGR
eukprot:1989316-Rhodomonas_salina.1